MSEPADVEASAERDTEADREAEVDGADLDTERTAVRTYVPTYQKEEWVGQAEEMDMSLSEFVRTMTQAGRRGFDGGRSRDNAANDEETPPEEPCSGDATPGVEDVETVLLDALREEARSYDELVDVALGDVRESVADDVNDALQSLQASNDVTHDPRAGGYTLMKE